MWAEAAAAGRGISVSSPRSWLDPGGCGSQGNSSCRCPASFWGAAHPLSPYPADGSIWLLTYALAVLMCLVGLWSAGAQGDLHREGARREPAKGGLRPREAEHCWRSRSRPPRCATSVTESLRMTVRGAE